MNAMVTTPMPPPKHPQNSEEGGGDCYVNVTTYVSARKPPTPVAYLAAAPSVPSSMVSFGMARTVKMRATDKGDKYVLPVIGPNAQRSRPLFP